MQITKLQPVNAGTLFWGIAVSQRGRRYDFCAALKGDPCAVFREDPTCRTHDGRTFWAHITAPKALRLAIRKAARS